MAHDDPGALCVTAAPTPTVASRLEGEEDAEDDDVEQAQLWRVTQELHYAAVNVGRKTKTTCAVLAPPPISFPSPHLTPPPNFLDLAASPYHLSALSAVQYVRGSLQVYVYVNE